MFASIAGLALALQLGGPAYAVNEGNPPVQEIQYRRHGRPPPCGHGYDVDSRDGMCYPNGMVPPNTNRAGIILWSTAAADDLCHAVMAPTPIFAMGSVIRPAQCRGVFSKAAKAIITVATATTKCGSAEPVDPAKRVRPESRPIHRATATAVPWHREARRPGRRRETSTGG